MHWSGSPRIFIIDDSITDCRLMSNSLQQAGYRVDFAIDGRQGLTSVLEHPPQCLILDVILPGTSGYAICRHLRQVDQHHTIPIIIISTKNTPLDEKYSLKLGANCFLAKPFSEEQLLRKVEMMLPQFSRVAAAQTIPLTVTSNNTSEGFTSSPEYALIPYHQAENDIMLRRSPFTGSAIVSDKQLSRLYSAINGHRSVQDLTKIVQLDIQATLKLLKTLWQQQRIAFYDAKRNPLKVISIFDTIK